LLEEFKMKRKEINKSDLGEVEERLRRLFYKYTHGDQISPEAAEKVRQALGWIESI